MFPRTTLGAALVFFIVFGVPLAAHAQSISATIPFSVSVSPQYPAPGGTATLSFLSNTLDLSNATLSVSVGGKSVYEGNAQQVTVPLGAAGTPTLVKSSMAIGGTVYSQNLTIVPQDVGLVAEPVASVAPLYLGKSIIPLEGTTRLVAIANLRTPSGKAIAPGALSYKWTVDGTVISNSSGIGRDSIMVASPLKYRTRNISVVVKSQDGSLVGGDSFSLSAQEPLVRLYENSPLYGIQFDHALGGAYSLAGSEATLYAAPFFFSTANGGPTLQWFLNGSPVQMGNSVTLRPTGTGQGAANLSLTVSGGSYSNATAALSLTFGSTSGTNLFGL